METNDTHAVHVLNSLIETTLDSANGYREAAERADDPQYKTMFSERSGRRVELIRQLQDEVRSFGGEPDTDQSVAGKLHNKFVAVRDAVMGSSDKAVIEEVERGEDFIKAEFEKAAGDTDLPPKIQELISTAYRSVKADHDEISRIKHQLH